MDNKSQKGKHVYCKSVDTNVPREIMELEKKKEELFDYLIQYLGELQAKLYTAFKTNETLTAEIISLKSQISQSTATQNAESGDDENTTK